MDTIAALLAAAVATGFAVELASGVRARPRPHAAAWATAMAAFAAATWALAIGLVFGWNDPIFRVFYWLGAIANIPLLAAGSVFLVLGPRAGRRFIVGATVFIFLGGVMVLATPVQGTLGGEVPHGSDAFGWTTTLFGVSLPGPRAFAAIAGGVGTLLIIGLALWSIVRKRRRARLVLGNLAIVVGTLAPAIGGTMTALGEGTALALSLLVGASFLWLGYRIASSGVTAVPNPVDVRG